MHEVEAIAQGCSDVVHELERRCPGAAFLAVHDNEIRRNAGFQHGLDHRHEFPMVPDAEFEAYRLASGKFAQFLNEAHQLKWR